MKREGHHHTARHRSSEEHGPKIESMPWVGTTWYRGGPAYWLRRALLSLFFLALCVFVAWIDGILVSVFYWGSTRGAPDRAAGLVALGIVIVVTIVSFVYMWTQTDRPRSDRERDREVKGIFIFEYIRLGYRWIVLILAVASLVVGGVIGRSMAAGATALVGLFFFGGAMCLLGPMLFLFMKSLTPVPEPVRLAREEVDAWYSAHGHDGLEPVRPT